MKYTQLPDLNIWVSATSLAVMKFQIVAYVYIICVSSSNAFKYRSPNRQCSIDALYDINTMNKHSVTELMFTFVRLIWSGNIRRIDIQRHTKKANRSLKREHNRNTSYQVYCLSHYSLASQMFGFVIIFFISVVINGFQFEKKKHLNAVLPNFIDLPDAHRFVTKKTSRHRRHWKALAHIQSDPGAKHLFMLKTYFNILNCKWIYIHIHMSWFEMCPKWCSRQKGHANTQWKINNIDLAQRERETVQKNRIAITLCGEFFIASDYVSIFIIASESTDKRVFFWCCCWKHQMKTTVDELGFFSERRQQFIRERQSRRTTPLSNASRVGIEASYAWCMNNIV